jgi:hypothetical protein
LIEAKQSAVDPFSEIEKLMTWEAFETSVAEASKLARPEEFDHLALLTQSYPQLRRYAPQLLEAFEFRATSGSEELLQAVALLRELNFKNARRVPNNAPSGFIRPRWQKHVFTSEGIDRRFYENACHRSWAKSFGPEIFGCDATEASEIASCDHFGANRFRWAFRLSR